MSFAPLLSRLRKRLPRMTKVRRKSDDRIESEQLRTFGRCEQRHATDRLLRFRRKGLEQCAKVPGQAGEVAHGHPSAPAAAGQLPGPAGPGQPRAQVVQVSLGNLDAEGMYLCAHGADPRRHLGQIMSYMHAILDIMGDTPARLLRLLSLLQTRRELALKVEIV